MENQFLRSVKECQVKLVSINLGYDPDPMYVRGHKMAMDIVRKKLEEFYLRVECLGSEELSINQKLFIQFVRDLEAYFDFLADRNLNYMDDPIVKGKFDAYTLGASCMKNILLKLGHS